MSRVRSPLRFPGGKSLAVKIIAPMVPPEYKVIVSPFMGGGSLELHWAQNGRRVTAYDGFLPLVRFWQEVLSDPTALANFVECCFPLSKTDFYSFQKGMANDDFFTTAARFFILNRASFSGTTMSGGCTKTPSEGKNARFTQSSIDRLREFANFQGKLTVNYSLWTDTLANHTTEAMYLDPPYMIGPKIYGARGDMHKDFDHKGLAAALRARTTPWLLSYNDCPEVRALYEGFKIETAEWSNSMGKKKRQQELLIRNY